MPALRVIFSSHMYTKYKLGRALNYHTVNEACILQISVDAYYQWGDKTWYLIQESKNIMAALTL